MLRHNQRYDRLLQRRSGLSLFELLVVLLLISLVAMFGLPWTTFWYQSQQSWIMRKDIAQAVAYGTQQSVILGEPLRLLPVHDQDWSRGLCLCKDSTLSCSEPDILYQWQWHSRGLKVVWHGFLSDAYLRFMPNLSQLALNGFFLIENGWQPPTKIRLNKLGRIRDSS